MNERSESPTQAQPHLSEQEMLQLELLYKTAPIGLALLDCNLRYVKLNERLAEINGKPVEYHIGRTIHEVIPGLADEVDVICRKVTENGMPVLNCEMKGTTSACPGSDKWWQVSYYPLKNNQGTVVGISTIVQDISERKEVERKLWRTMNSLAEAQRIAHLGNWDWDIENNELIWSDEIYRIFGLAPQEFGATYEAFLASVHPDDRESVKRGVDGALYHDKPYSIDHRIVLRDGSERIVHEQAEVIFNRDGRPSRMIGTVQDVTEAKRAEAALQERLRFEQFHSGLSTEFMNLPGERVAPEIVRGLRGVAELMALDWAAVLEFSESSDTIRVTHYWAPPEVPKLGTPVVNDRFQWYANQIRKGVLLALERLPHDLPEGAEAEAHFCSEKSIQSCITIPLKIGGANLGAVAFGSLRSHTAWSPELVRRLTLIAEIFANALLRKRTEESSRKLRAELSHVARVTTMGELTASLAHELNQPLTAILNNARAAQRFLSQDAPDYREVGDILEDIVADDKRAGGIIANLRALLKKGEPKSESFDFHSVAEEVIALLESDAIIRNTRLELLPSLHLPPVRGDRIQLQQVLMNLLLNALDAVTEQPADFRKVIVWAQPFEEAKVKISIRDFGAGLHESVEKLFEPFFSTKAEGLGMGLPISKSIVEAQGGRIWAENNGDRGAIFSFTIPVAGGA